MSASLVMEFKMTKGTNEDFQAILHALEEIGQQPLDKLRDLWIGDRSFTIENMFPNIWGDEWLVR